MSYLAIAKAAEDRMRAERDPGAVLADLYRKYWNAPETEPIDTFKGLYREIDILERRVGVSVAWRTLEATAGSWYAEHQVCPFCKRRGVLHLAAEQPGGEVGHG